MPCFLKICSQMSFICFISCLLALLGHLHILFGKQEIEFSMYAICCILIAGVVWLEMQFVHISSWRFVLNNSEG